jgi:L-ascorbate metabolism protein UlaG (beta-lactamase superfamily)
MFGTMTPAQAVTATRILGAKVLVPMHYAQFHNAPGYTQFPDIENALDQSGAEQEIVIRPLKDGETMVL